MVVGLRMMNFDGAEWKLIIIMMIGIISMISYIILEFKKGEE